MKPSIDKNIPIPSRTGRIYYHEHIAIAKELEVGESVFCSSRGEMQAVVQSLRLSGKKPTQQLQIGGGWRVWRVE